MAIRDSTSEPTVFVKNTLRPYRTPQVERMTVKVATNEEELRLPPMATRSLLDDNGGDWWFGLGVRPKVKETPLAGRRPEGVTI